MICVITSCFKVDTSHSPINVRILKIIKSLIMFGGSTENGNRFSWKKNSRSVFTASTCCVFFSFTPLVLCVY